MKRVKPLPYKPTKDEASNSGKSQNFGPSVLRYSPSKSKSTSKFVTHTAPSRSFRSRVVENNPPFPWWWPVILTEEGKTLSDQDRNTAMDSGYPPWWWPWSEENAESKWWLWPIRPTSDAPTQGKNTAMGSGWWWWPVAEKNKENTGMGAELPWWWPWSEENSLGRRYDAASGAGQVPKISDHCKYVDTIEQGIIMRCRFPKKN